MDLYLKDILEEKYENHILPFLWLHGEDELLIREEILRIYESGIKAFCVESRPHPDFLGPLWWRDMDIIMDEARKKDMKVWLLDDATFPTGFAAGRVKDKYPELKKWYIAERHIDALGPAFESSFIINQWISDGEKLIKVIASKRVSEVDEFDDSLIDITEKVQDGVLYWDVPEGYWRVFILVMTRKGGEEWTKDFLNPIVKESTRVLIDTVYESHLEHYKDDFGKTFAGFFSDEPRFGNYSTYYSSIGRVKMVLPWREDMIRILDESFGSEFIRYLPCLWYDVNKVSGEVRYKYMDIVTKLYAENFTDQIGNWCRNHGVEYIGHVIEDNNAHARLGVSTGHFFRTLWGQDMSGIDVVLNQIIPGFDKDGFSFTPGPVDGEFYHYGLAKMGASLGHLDSKKKGRTMCEIFGAYGWYEGLKLMKWLTDHMMVRGVNYLVPHAFTPKEYPDPDCPPHFYANGFNPQYRYFKILMNYANRVCHLLSGGLHIASAAVLYHAEAEWAGEYMYFHKVVKELMQNQIDCDVVPAEVISKEAACENNKLYINGENYDCLIIPYAEALPQYLLIKVNEFLMKGLKVYFINEMPSLTIRQKDEIIIENIYKNANTSVISIEKIAEEMNDQKFRDIITGNYQPYLRYYHYRRENTDIYMFFNEDPYNNIKTTIDFKINKNIFMYDGFENSIKMQCTELLREGIRIELDLSPYESRIFILGDVPEKYILNKDEFLNIDTTNKFLVDGEWNISLATSKQYPCFQKVENINRLQNLSVPGLLPKFSGTIRYEISFDWNKDSKTAILKMHNLYETAEVWINNKHAGIKICPPYSFDISNFLKKGINTLIIDVTNTLVKEQQDKFSSSVQQEPTGLIGPVFIAHSS